MKKIVPVLAFVVFLGGCAAFGPSTDNPQLVEAYETARDALQKANEVGAQDTHSEDFNTVRDRMAEIRDEQQNNPSMELVDAYRNAERGAYEVAIRSLQQQLNQTESSFEDLQNQLDDLRSELQDRVRSLEKQNQDLERENQTLKDQLAERKSLGKQVEELKEEKASLRQEISSLQEEISSLQEEISSLREERSQLRARLGDRGDTIALLRTELTDREKRLQELQQENEQIQSELNENLDEGDVRTENQRIYIALESKILFGVGNVHVQDSIQEELNSIADILQKYPDREILVEGHTDDLPLQNELKEKYGSNWELSGQRAINVLKYLVYARDIEPERIGAVAYGKFRPRVANNSDENRAQNRRVEIVLLPPELPMETKSLTE